MKSKSVCGLAVLLRDLGSEPGSEKGEQRCPMLSSDDSMGNQNESDRSDD